MKKVLCLSLAMLLVLFAFAACNKEEAHTHTYAADWTYDETNHWHKATCEHTDEKSGLGEHVDSDGDLMCDVCQRIEEHTHTYEETWTSNEESHWHKASCGHSLTKDAAPHVDADNNGICDVCAYDEKCAHEYKTEWTTDANKHWHDTACGHSMGKKDEADHVDANNDGACDVCAYVSCTHQFNQSWSSDKENHWKDPACGHTVAPIEKGAHTGMEDNTCDVCGYVKAHEHTYETTYTITGEGHYYAATCEHTGEKSSEAAHADKNGDDKCDACGYTMKLVLFENVLSGASQFQDVAQYKNSEDILKLNLAAGKYVITSSTSTDIRFGEMGVEDWGDVAFIGGTSYVFTVETAGEREIIARYNTWDPVTNTTMDYSYTIIKIDDLELDTLSGANRVMASNTLYTVSITVPKAGVYTLTSSIDGLAWNDNLVKTFVIGTTEDNQTVTFTLMYASETEATFSFDWKLGTFEKVTLQDGENKVNVPNNTGYLQLEYVVTVPGSYAITTNSDFVSFYVWSDPYDIGYNMNYYSDIFSNLKAGDVITVYVKAYVYDENFDFVNVATLEDLITVTNLGNIMTDDDGDNAYDALAGTDGVENSLEVSEGGDYVLTAPDGVEISLDGGLTWVTTVEVTLEADSIQKLLIKSATLTDVQITLIKKSYEFTLTVGDNTVSMIPGKEYSVILEGFGNPAYYKDFILSWTDANIVVTYDYYTTVASGTQYSGYTTWSELIIVYNGTETAEIAFTLVDPVGAPQPVTPDVAATWFNGSYKVDFYGMVLYSLTFTPGTDATTGTLVIVDENTTAYTGTYTYTVSADGVVVTDSTGAVTDIAFFVNGDGKVTFSCGDLGTPTEIIADSGEGEGDDTPDTPDAPVAGDAEKALNGTYNVNWIMNGIYVLIFEDGVLTVQDNNNNAYSGTYYYVCGENSSITVTNTDGSASDILLTYGLDGSLMFQCPGLKTAQPLEKQEESGDEGEVDPTDSLVLGDNAIAVTDAWNGAQVTFTATEAGTYVLSLADGENNAFIMYEPQPYMSEEIILPYTFTLEAGGSITFIVLTANWEVDTIDLVLTAASGSDDSGDAPVAGDAEKALNGTYNVNWIMNGIYVLIFEDGVLTVQDNNNNAYSGTYYYVCGENSSITVTNTDGSASDILLTYGLDGSLMFQCPGLKTAQPLEKQEESGDEGEVDPTDSLVLGDNAIAVTDAWNGAQVTFTATEAGTYVLSLADGENNAFIMYEPQPYMSEEIILPYTFTLEAGGSITFIVLTANWEVDTIDLVVAQA